jgi:hypothetical protein
LSLKSATVKVLGEFYAQDHVQQKVNRALSAGRVINFCNLLAATVVRYILKAAVNAPNLSLQNHNK